MKPKLDWNFFLSIMLWGSFRFRSIILLLLNCTSVHLILFCMSIFRMLMCGTTAVGCLAICLQIFANGDFFVLAGYF